MDLHFYLWLMMSACAVALLIITIMQAALIATADIILYGRAPTENYAFKAILKPYKNKEL